MRNAECLPRIPIFYLPGILYFKYLFFYINPEQEQEQFLVRRFLLVSLCLSSEIAGMGRVLSAHVTLFPSVTFVFYLAIRSFPSLGLTVIRETS